jgi:hypothetical protein
MHINHVTSSTIQIKLSCTEFCLSRGKRNFAENHQRVFILTNAFFPVLFHTSGNMSDIVQQKLLETCSHFSVQFIFRSKKESNYVSMQVCSWQDTEIVFHAWAPELYK